MRKNTVATQRLYVRIGESIRRLRKAECISEDELARRMHISQGHLNRVETGETPCSLHLLVALADEFDVSLDELVPVAIDEKELVA